MKHNFRVCFILVWFLVSCAVANPTAAPTDTIAVASPTLTPTAMPINAAESGTSSEGYLPITVKDAVIGQAENTAAPEGLSGAKEKYDSMTNEAFLREIAKSSGLWKEADIQAFIKGIQIEYTQNKLGDRWNYKIKNADGVYIPTVDGVAAEYSAYFVNGTNKVMGEAEGVKYKFVGGADWDWCGTKQCLVGGTGTALVDSVEQEVCSRFLLPEGLTIEEIADKDLNWEPIEGVAAIDELAALRETVPVFLDKDSKAEDIPVIDVEQWPDITPADLAKLAENMPEVPWHTELGAKILVMKFFDFINGYHGDIVFGMNVNGLKSLDQAPVRTMFVMLDNADKINNPELAKVLEKRNIKRLLAVIYQVQTAYDHNGDGKKDVLTGVGGLVGHFVDGTNDYSNKFDKIIEYGTIGSKTPIILVVRMSPWDHSSPIKRQTSDMLGGQAMEDILIAQGPELIVSANKLGSGAEMQLYMSTKKGFDATQIELLKWWWGVQASGNISFFLP